MFQNASRTMTAIQREKFLKVAGFRPVEMGPILFTFFRYPQFEQILDWCIEQKMTGATLERWVKEKHQARPHMAASYILTGAP